MPASWVDRSGTIHIDLSYYSAQSIVVSGHTARAALNAAADYVDGEVIKEIARDIGPEFSSQTEMDAFLRGDWGWTAEF